MDLEEEKKCRVALEHFKKNRYLKEPMEELEKYLFKDKEG